MSKSEKSWNYLQLNPLANTTAYNMKDKLFILTNSVNPKVVGRKQPQVEAIYSEDVTYTSIGDHILEKLHPAEVILPEIKLKTPNAILTDYISNNLTVYPFQILISEKTLGILKKYTGAPHQIFNANLIHTKGSTRYYILHYLPSTVSYLDFQRSQFVRVYWTEKTTESFSAKNYQEFVNTPGLGGAKQVKALYLKSNIQLPDFFPVSPPGISRRQCELRTLPGKVLPMLKLTFRKALLIFKSL